LSFDQIYRLKKYFFSSEYGPEALYGARKFKVKLLKSFKAEISLITLIINNKYKEKAYDGSQQLFHDQFRSADQISVFKSEQVVLSHELKICFLFTQHEFLFCLRQMTPLEILCLLIGRGSDH